MNALKNSARNEHSLNSWTQCAYEWDRKWASNFSLKLYGSAGMPLKTTFTITPLVLSRVSCRHRAHMLFALAFISDFSVLVKHLKRSLNFSDSLLYTSCMRNVENCYLQILLSFRTGVYANRNHVIPNEISFVLFKFVPLSWMTKPAFFLRCIFFLNQALELWHNIVLQRCYVLTFAHSILCKFFCRK